jgi:hypothetical protein
MHRIGLLYQWLISLPSVDAHAICVIDQAETSSEKTSGCHDDFGPAKGCAALDRDQSCSQFGADEQRNRFDIEGGDGR